MKRAINKFMLALGLCAGAALQASASSHREAPMIAYDPQADNTDVYAFKSPTDSTKIVIICDYIPFQLPQGGPNYYNFGQNIRYEIHVKNSTATNGDDITYRFTFQNTNEDTTTFFNIRAGKQNLKTTYTCERSLDHGVTFSTIVSGGYVPPNNIGPRSIDGPVGLNAGSYDSLMRRGVTTANTGERVFAGPIDDPFFVDLGGIFDLGGVRNPGRDGLAKYNVHTIALEVPITTLQKNGLGLPAAGGILDANYVIGVWASASRQVVTTLNNNGTPPSTSGIWIQVSRLGMPLTNEAIIPIGSKDAWDANNPANDATLYGKFFKNPELALYMASGTATNGPVTTTYYGAYVPGLYPILAIQAASGPNVGLPTFDFRNGQKGLWPLKGNPALVGTAFDPATYGNILIPDSTSPRAVDILPIFLTGVPNLPPYQLAVANKTLAGQLNPLRRGKPFINNFLPTLGDMLRLNMAVPATPRNSAAFSSDGLLQAAVIALTTPATYGDTTVQFIPNMDGFPNGRRLEDDVTRIELQAVGGLVLAAVGLPFDDYTASSGAGNIATPRLLGEVGFTAGPTTNDTTFKTAFPFVQQPWRGFNGSSYVGPMTTGVHDLGITAPVVVMAAFPNPFSASVNFRYKISTTADVQINVVDVNGRTVQVIKEGRKAAGEYTAKWNGAGTLAAGNYFAEIMVGGNPAQTIKLVKTN